MVVKITAEWFHISSCHIYNVIRTSIKNFIVTNKLPFGILADKMTSKHLTRHMVGIRIPIWDIRSSFLVRDLYIQCSPTKDVTGLGVTEHVIETFGIDRSDQRDNLSGCAMDGQYIHLNFSGHLSNILLKEYHLTWDPAHRIELSINDSSSKPNESQTFVEVTCNTIQSIMTQMSYGKPYRALLDDTPLIDHFLTPKIFKSMKFVGHCTSVLKSFTSNFKGIISTLERMNTRSLHCNKRYCPFLLFWII